MQQFRDHVEGKFQEAGLNQAEYVSCTSSSANFGSASVIFQLDTLLLRIVRDRGQEFLDLAPNSLFQNFYQFDDVEIAMGWKTVDQVLKKRVA